MQFNQLVCSSFVLLHHVPSWRTLLILLSSLTLFHFTSRFFMFFNKRFRQPFLIAVGIYIYKLQVKKTRRRRVRCNIEFMIIMNH